MQTGGVMIGVPVFDCFVNVGNDGIIKYDPNKDINSQGGHAQLLIGWKQINGKFYWITVNSWGTEWGDNGVGYLPENYPWSDNAYAVVDQVKETTLKQYYAEYYAEDSDGQTLGSSYADYSAYKAAKQLFWGGLNSYTPSGKALFVKADKFGETHQDGRGQHIFHG